MTTETQAKQAPAQQQQQHEQPATNAAATAPASDVAAASASAPADATSTPAEDGVATVEAGVEAMSMGGAAPQPQSELHRACAEGKLEDVRAILSRGGLDSLESLDIATGCTPVVLAVTQGHADVVRELLSAGAIVPPPGLTMDPTMLSILYPQPMFGVPPPFMGGPQFFGQPGYFPGGPGGHFAPRSEANGHAPNGNHSNGQANGNAPNLPPAEVAKTIPCRNFPHCKYGNSCMFFHPRPQPGFFPPQGYYEGGFVPYPPGAQPFYPGAQEFVPQQNGHAEAGEAAASENGSAAPAPSSESTTQHDSIPASQPPSAGAPAFVPGMPPHGAGEMPNGAPFSPSAGFMSPPLMPVAPPNDPAFFATSPPPQFQHFMPNGAFPPGPGRRQSFGQFNGHPPKPYHGKKPSFSGGPKPWGPGGRPGGSSHLGQWKDGNPPPCAFFREGKCRNGEFCKFPHLDAEGNDCRHPDVVRGIIPPMPTRPPRALRMMHGQYPHQHMAAKHAQAAAAAGGNVAETAEDGATTPETPASDKDGSGSASASLPPKPSGSLPPSRSASQPGVSRVHAANGINSRSHSPSGRRGPRGYPNGHTSRSSSNGGDKKPAPPQRIPRADEFPSLGGTPSAERRETSWGKTAAQVLSAPAPVKPVSPASPKESPKEPVEEKKEDKTAAAAAPESPVVTMDSDSEQDAVIVSVSTTPNPEIAKAKLPASSVSFASVISSETAPVALTA